MIFYKSCHTQFYCFLSGQILQHQVDRTLLRCRAFTGFSLICFLSPLLHQVNAMMVNAHCSNRSKYRTVQFQWLLIIRWEDIANGKREGKRLQANYPGPRWCKNTWNAHFFLTSGTATSWAASTWPTWRSCPTRCSRRSRPPSTRGASPPSTTITLLLQTLKNSR